MSKMFKENGFLSDEGKAVLQPLHDALMEVMASPDIRGMSAQELLTLQGNLAKLIGDVLSGAIHGSKRQTVGELPTKRALSDSADPRLDSSHPWAGVVASAVRLVDSGTGGQASGDLIDAVRTMQEKAYGFVPPYVPKFEPGKVRQAVRRLYEWAIGDQEPNEIGTAQIDRDLTLIEDAFGFNRLPPSPPRNQ